MNTAEHRIPISPQSSSSTDAEAPKAIPVREMLPPLGSQHLKSGNRDITGRMALTHFWPEGIDRISCRQLGARFNTALMRYDRSLMDLGTAVQTIEKAGLDWRQMRPSQKDQESPIDFVLRVIATANKLRDEEARMAMAH